MGKPKVFISFYTKDKDFAIELKKNIQMNFHNGLDIFVSSDTDSLSLGSNFNEEILNNLKISNLLISVCSKDSVNRPWVNFELGAAYMNGIKCIPLCCLGMTVDKLPSPISLFQACNLNEEKLTDLYNEIAKLKNESIRKIGDYNIQSLLDLNTNILNSRVDNQFLIEIEELLPNFKEEITKPENEENGVIKLVNNQLPDYSFKKLKQITLDNPKVNIELNVKYKALYGVSSDEFYFLFDIIVPKTFIEEYLS